MGRRRLHSTRLVSTTIMIRWLRNIRNIDQDYSALKKKEGEGCGIWDMGYGRNIVK
jgi:hypothetical protein